MKIKRKCLLGIVATALTIFGANAHADPITVGITFDANDISPFSYDFPTQGGTTNSGNCPDDISAGVDRPCVQLASGDSLVVSVTPPPDTFDLISFYWEYTGNQVNSILTVSFLPETVGTSTYPVDLNEDTVFQMVNALDITQITFLNTTNSVVRLDNISLTYDDGLCGNEPCNGHSVPEPGTLGLLGLGLLGLSLGRRRQV